MDGLHVASRQDNEPVRARREGVDDVGIGVRSVRCGNSRRSKTGNMHKIFVICVALVAATDAFPQGLGTSPCPNLAYQTQIQPHGGGEVICVNEWSINEEGCTVGPSGEMVCPAGNRGAGGDSVTFRGNKGHRGTGSNGNAGPVGGNGLPVDPAAVTYLKQIEEYQKWAEREAARG